MNNEKANMAQRYEREIPEGYEARIEGNKVIIEHKESEDERIRKAIEGTIRVYGKTQGEWLCGYDMDTLVVHLREAFGALEKQKEPRDYRKLYEEVVKSDWFKENYFGKSLGEDQQPAEWSEEDKKKLDFVISVCIDAQRPSGCVEGSVYYNKLNEAKKWLKSLRPQPHWKPSEEQMEALKYALGKGGTYNKEALDSLLTDLQNYFSL